MMRAHGPQRATVVDALTWAWSNARAAAHISVWEVAPGETRRARAVRKAAAKVEHSRWALVVVRARYGGAYQEECRLRLERASLRLAAALAWLWGCPRGAVFSVWRTARALELQILEMYRESIEAKRRAELAALAEERRA